MAPTDHPPDPPAPDRALDPSGDPAGDPAAGPPSALIEDLDLDAVAPEAIPGLRLLPVVHDRIELAALARAVLDRLDPAAVAVELPPAVGAAVERAIERLPRVSLVLAEEPGEEALAWAAAPGDPFVEALRWAHERGRPRFYFDPDLPATGPRLDQRGEPGSEPGSDPGGDLGGDRSADRGGPVPDPWALLRLGAAAYLAGLVAAAAAPPPSERDRRREAGMAYHLRRALGRLDREVGEGGGEAPAGRERGRPRAEAREAGAPPRRYPLLALVGAAHAGRLAAALAAPAATPLVRRRKQAVELRHLHPESLTALLPDPPLAHAAWELLRRLPDEPLPAEPPLAATRARRLTLVKAGLRLISREPEPWGADRQHRLAELAAHRGAAPGPGGRRVPDRWRLGRLVWAAAAGSWHEQTGGTAAGWQRRLFFDYARRHAVCQGQLVPGLYEWVVAGRGVADDNLAWELFDTARAYPWQPELAEIATVRVDGDELDLGTRKVRFRRRFFRVKQRPVPVRARPRPVDPERWLEGFAGGSLCSYPPEDLVVEDYGRFLRAKAEALLSAERSHTEPFATSLLDGVDVRETLAHPEDRRVWVREQRRAPGRAGSVVVIFDRDRGADRYPYRMTWLGEHDQESDMAFYSTHPAEQVVGPGILRATYGGFLMTVPPGRLADVWTDPDYRDAGEKAEVLVRAAVDYSLDRFVVHLAARPPAEALRRYAAEQGKRIVHVPLGSASPAMLARVRTLHILVGHDKRAIARDYVW